MKNSSPGSVEIAAVNPASLAHEDFVQIHEFTQDMWAEGSGELIKCHACGRVSGKKEVFPQIPKDIYQETVSKIFDILEQEFPIECPNCGSRETEIVNKPEKIIEVIKKRLLQSIESSVVIMRDKINREIVGYMDAYVDSFENAFKWELQPHYPEISPQDMKTRIESLLDKDVSKIIVFPALGISQRYRSPFTLARLLRYFAEVTVFQDEESIPGLMEIGKDNTTYKIFMEMGGHSLNDTDYGFFRKHLQASPNYDSVIAVFPECMRPFRTKLTRNSVRGILNSRKD